MKNITYRQVADYMIPTFTLPPKEASIRLGKWGMLHKDYLLKHKKAVFTSLLAEGKLYQHCAEIEKQVREMFDALVEQMKKAECITEQLKDENHMEWVRSSNNICERAMEIVNQELIYT